MEKKFKITENMAIAILAIGVITLVISGFIFFVKGSWVFSIDSNIDESKIGQYGDFVGGIIGSLFSLVGIILFYVALQEQRKDFSTNQKTLKIQIDAFQKQVEEFELQRGELIETRKIYEQQDKTMKKQQFESNFYSFLNVFLDQRKSLDPNGYTEYFRGIISYLAKIELLATDNLKISFEKTKSEYLNIYIAERAKLSLYFITFYRLLRLIEDSPNIINSEKIVYHKLLRSLITKDELLILYYNYHSPFAKKPVPIVLAYNYFKHLDLMSKIEFILHYNGKIKEASKLNKLIDDLSNLIFLNLEKAKNIEVNEIKEEFELEDSVYIGIEIEDSIVIKIIIDNSCTSILNEEIIFFGKLFEGLLVDILYHSKFIDFNQDVLNKSIITKRDQVIHQFEFIQIDHL
jgi:hypothetical protein